jgi:anaerobic dimethyl sulfoxide reductase subunit C (anchor subunit)
MGMGWQEWPLILFTVFGQCVVGALIIMGLAQIAGGLSGEQSRSLHRAMLMLWLLMGLAFAASFMHLGSPLRALNSLNRLGSSGLSNEIAGGSAFFAVGGIYWLLAVMGKMPRALGKWWLLLTMALGLIFVYIMARVYRIDTVPTWDNNYTTLNFFSTVLIGGPLLGALLLRAAGLEAPGRRLLVILSLAGLLISMGAAVMQGSALAGIHSAVQQASALVPQYGQLMAWRLMLVALGLGCWLYPLLRRGQAGVAAMTLGFVLVAAGELIGRGVFYGLHMTVGMAVVT